VDWVVVLNDVGVMAVLYVSRLRGDAITHYIIYILDNIIDVNICYNIIIMMIIIIVRFMNVYKT
jgi:hypothetical protein